MVFTIAVIWVSVLNFLQVQLIVAALNESSSILGKRIVIRHI